MRRGPARKGMHSMDQLLSAWRGSRRPGGGTGLKERGGDISLTAPSILAHCRELETLERSFVRVLPANMREKFCLAKYDEGELVVFCADVHHASYLRYHATEMIRSLTRLPEFEKLTRITVHKDET